MVCVACTEDCKNIMSSDENDNLDQTIETSNNTNISFLDSMDKKVEGVFLYKNKILYIDQDKFVWQVDELLWALVPVEYYCPPFYYETEDCSQTKYYHQNMLENFTYECNEILYYMPGNSTIKNICSYKFVTNGECYKIENCQMKYVVEADVQNTVFYKPDTDLSPLHIGIQK